MKRIPPIIIKIVIFIIILIAAAVQYQGVEPGNKSISSCAIDSIMDPTANQTLNQTLNQTFSQTPNQAINKTGSQIKNTTVINFPSAGQYEGSVKLLPVGPTPSKLNWS
jgi:hypothetical protein